MKKNSFYLFAMMMVAMVCVGFASCSSDDDDEGDAGLVGTWHYVSYETHYNNGKVEVNDPNRYGVESYWHFNADGTMDGYEYWEGKFDVAHFTYKYEGKTLTMDEFEYEVISLTKTELKIKQNNSDGYIIETHVKVSDSVIAGIK